VTATVRIGVHPDDVPRVNGLVLYRLYDARAGYLYIGSGVLAARLVEHRTKPWFPRVEMVTWEPYPARAEKRLRQDELRLIVLHQPRFNGKGKNHRCHLPRHIPVSGVSECRSCGLVWLFDGYWRLWRDDRR